MRASTWIFAVSLAAHGLLGVGIGSLRAKPQPRQATAIAMTESKKKAAPKPKPKPPPPPKEEPPKPKAEAKAKTAEAKPLPEAPAAKAAAMNTLPDFGLNLSGGVGGDGLAIPAAPVAAAGTPEAAQGPARVAAKTAPAGRKPAVDECSEAVVKPKPESVPQPSYTPAAREANVQGRVRVEVSVDASGRVTAARLLAGLGYGLDEAALTAARAASFAPATRCGRATTATFVIAMRFSL